MVKNYKMNARRGEQTQPHKNGGFALILLCTLLPVILTLTLSLGFHFFFLKKTMEFRHLCRSELLSGQKVVGDKLRILLSLNPKIRALKVIQRVPALSPAAQALASMALTGLRIYQRYLIGRAYYELASLQISVRRKIPGAQMSLPRLAIRPLFRLDPYPEYILKAHFEQLQDQKAWWRLEVTPKENHFESQTTFRLDPTRFGSNRWGKIARGGYSIWTTLNRFLGRQGNPSLKKGFVHYQLQKDEGCSVTLDKNTLKPRLSEVRSSSRWL